jgi:hypothetical protein
LPSLILVSYQAHPSHFIQVIILLHSMFMHDLNMLLISVTKRWTHSHVSKLEYRGRFHALSFSFVIRNSLTLSNKRGLILLGLRNSKQTFNWKTECSFFVRNHVYIEFRWQIFWFIRFFFFKKKKKLTYHFWRDGDLSLRVSSQLVSPTWLHVKTRKQKF